MAIIVKNVPLSPPKTFSQEELEVGVLYKNATPGFSTIYVKTNVGDIFWFEDGGRIGSGPRKGQAYGTQYVLAPVGTEVILS